MLRRSPVKLLLRLVWGGESKRPLTLTSFEHGDWLTRLNVGLRAGDGMTARYSLRVAQAHFITAMTKPQTEFAPDAHHPRFHFRRTAAARVRALCERTRDDRGRAAAGPQRSARPTLGRSRHYRDRGQLACGRQARITAARLYANVARMHHYRRRAESRKPAQSWLIAITRAFRAVAANR